MRAVLPLIVIVAAIGPTPTLAAVLTAGGENICTTIDDGKPAVDKDKLALAIVAEAQAVNFLDGANPGGVKNNSIDLQSVGAALSEPAYAVLNAGAVSPAKANRPFGPNVDLNKNEEAAAARDAIDRIFREEIQFLTINPQIKVDGVNSQGIPASTVYRIQRREDVVGAPQDERDWMSPELVFSGRSTISYCLRAECRKSRPGVGR